MCMVHKLPSLILMYCSSVSTVTSTSLVSFVPQQEKAVKMCDFLSPTENGSRLSIYAIALESRPALTTTCLRCLSISARRQVQVWR